MVTAALILAFSLMFVLAVSAMGVAVYGIKEAARSNIALFQHWTRAEKANNVQELVKAEGDTKRAELDLELLKQSWEKEFKQEISDGKIPVPQPKLVTSVDGRRFDMSELETL